MSIPSDAGLVAILVLAFGTGMVHALDADHIAAVTGLAARRASLSSSVRAAGAWALGHGLTLLALGTVVYLLGVALPERLGAVAERAVGLVLVIIGVSLFRQLLVERAHVHAHTHDGLPAHAHLHTHSDDQADDRADAHGRHGNHTDDASGDEAVDPAASRHDHLADPHDHHHGAVLVGSIHGAAGSAPILALIPLAQLGSAWVALAYLVVFGLGVGLAMLAFGGALGHVFRLGSRSGRNLVTTMQTLTATFSVALGLWWLAAG